MTEKIKNSEEAKSVKVTENKTVLSVTAEYSPTDSSSSLGSYAVNPLESSAEASYHADTIPNMAVSADLQDAAGYMIADLNLTDNLQYYLMPSDRVLQQNSEEQTEEKEETKTAQDLLHSRHIIYTEMLGMIIEDAENRNIIEECLESMKEQYSDILLCECVHFFRTCADAAPAALIIMLQYDFYRCLFLAGINPVFKTDLSESAVRINRRASSGGKKPVPYGDYRSETVMLLDYLNKRYDSLQMSPRAKLTQRDRLRMKAVGIRNTDSAEFKEKSLKHHISLIRRRFSFDMKGIQRTMLKLLSAPQQAGLPEDMILHVNSNSEELQRDSGDGVTLKGPQTLCMVYSADPGFEIRAADGSGIVYTYKDLKEGNILLLNGLIVSFRAVSRGRRKTAEKEALPFLQKETEPSLRLTGVLKGTADPYPASSARENSKAVLSAVCIS